MSCKAYPVRGYWHSDGSGFEKVDGESFTRLSRSELYAILLKNKGYGYTYYDPDTYKKSYTIVKVGELK